jgi:hypothetical protein
MKHSLITSSAFAAGMFGMVACSPAEREDEQTETEQAESEETGSEQSTDEDDSGEVVDMSGNKLIPQEVGGE